MIHRPRKRFGQNFLRDRGVIERILDDIDPQPGERLVEIGPGRGALTRGLLQRVGKLDAVELDRNLVQLLRNNCAPRGELCLHNADALRFDFRTLRHDERRLRLVGNLPYNISTPLLFHLLEQVDAIEDMHFMLQKEVVDRMAAEPGSRTYGRLSVMLQVSCDVKPLFDIGPEAFNPPPQVDSSMVRLRPLPQPLVTAEQLGSFGDLINKAFAQRRKTLRNNLKHVLDGELIGTLGIDSGARPETLSVEDFVRLHQRISESQA